VAQVLRDVARDSDIVGRYGGEEFVVIAPSTDTEGATALAERLRTALEGGRWPLRAVTASFGVSTESPVYPEASGTSPATLIANADSALYRSKDDGRNRVTAFESVDVARIVDKAA
jgi:diguanylate cyclase (GGDEF)-like protein